MKELIEKIQKIREGIEKVLAQKEELTKAAEGIQFIIDLEKTQKIKEGLEKVLTQKEELVKGLEGIRSLVSRLLGQEKQDKKAG